MAAISMAVSALWAQASLVRVCKPGGINSRFRHVWTSRVESTADSAMCGQAWWNQQPILPCVDKPGGISSRFCHVWTSLVESAADSAMCGQALWNQQPILPCVDKPGGSTANSAKCGQVWPCHIAWHAESTTDSARRRRAWRGHTMAESTANSATCK